jgi:serine/threonine-protein kinase
MSALRRRLSVALAAWGLTAAVAAAAPDGGDLAVRARDVLKQHCYRCHSGSGSSSGEPFDVTRHETLVKPAGDGEPVVVASSPEKSALWKAVQRRMPQRGSPEREGFGDEQRQVLQKWILAGAPPFPAVEARRFVSMTAVLQAVRDDLRAADESRRHGLRYFTLTHLHNNPNVSASDLRLVRAGLAKALNSMSWQPDLVLPRAVDPDQTVFAVDVGELGWEREDLWRAVMREYPYGLSYAGSRDQRLRRLDQDIAAETDCDLPVVRADWFVALATQPPLYHTLLELPRDARVLEERLRVDVLANFRSGRLVRAGFATSGVSGQNRLVERHPAAHGAYWKSYDFKARTPRNVLTRFPLGPEFDGNPFPQQAFRQAGGELIFNLPNGLQGYLLVNARDERIDAGPVEIVSDALKTAGTPAVINGLSCMSCHKHGMIPFKDAIRDGTAVGGDALRLVQQLYPPQATLDRLVRDDGKRFLDALERATGPFLRVGPDRDQAVRDFPEPVGEVARAYLLKDLGPAEAAYELGLERPEQLRSMIEGSAALRALGLAPLTAGRSIRRDEWETLDGTSLFQKVARELQLGSPLRPVN